jgi:hypothetical protein
VKSLALKKFSLSLQHEHKQTWSDETIEILGCRGLHAGPDGDARKGTEVGTSG